MPRRLADAPEITEVFDGLFPPEYRQRLVVMLRAFLDGSTAGHPPILSVAGFVSSVEEWRKFQRHWRDARKKAGIDYFRTTDFMSCRAKPYRHWDARKKGAMISRLLHLINVHARFGVAIALNLDDFRAQSAAIKRSWGYKPYRLCAAQCIGRVALALDDWGIRESVMYVFESGDEGEPAFRESMTRIVTASERFRKEMHVYSVMPGTKRQFPALDAADFLAWQSSQHVQRMEGDNPAPRSSYMERLKIPIRSGVMRGNNLREWAVGDTPEQRDLIAKTFGVRIRPEKKPKERRPGVGC